MLSKSIIPAITLLSILIYGSNAIGGTIRYITNKPDSSSSYGKIRVGYGNKVKADDPETSIEMMYNLPLSAYQQYPKILYFVKQIYYLVVIVQLTILPISSPLLKLGRLP